MPASVKIKFIVTGYFIVHCLFLQAQEFTFPGYGQPPADEVSMTECLFDKDANAIVLLHEAFSDYDDSRQLITFHHVRIKIFNEKALSEANIKIPYYRKDDFEYISRVEGFTLNAAGSGELVKIKLDKKSIFDQKKSDSWGEVSLAFPAVKPGSIIEYSYRSIMKHYGGLDKWVFQESLPVLASKYRLAILPNAEFAYVVHKRQDLPIIITPESSQGRIYFEMQNVPGLDEEPYMDSRSDYLQKITFQLSGFNFRGRGKDAYLQTWDQAIKEMLNEDQFGKQVDKNIPGSNEFIKQVEGLSPEARITAIYDLVRKSMQWNQIHSKYAESVKAAWQAKQGTSGEINLLLVNLLKAAGLEAYPMLVSERWHGKVNTDYPFLDQFNTVFACVMVGDNKYYLDATDPYASPRLIPYDILNTTALIVNKKRGGLVKISNEFLQYDDQVRTQLVLDASGKVTGKTLVTSSDYARVKRRMDHTENKEAFLTKYFHKNTERLSLSEINMQNETADSLQLLQEATFEMKNTSDGNYFYLPLDLFSTFNENPFIAEERFSNVNFGYKRSIAIQTMIIYPDNLAVEDLPKPMKMTTPEKDIVISRLVEHDKANRLITAKIILEFKSGLYDVNSYPVLREVYKKLFSVLKEPVLLKKK